MDKIIAKIGKGDFKEMVESSVLIVSEHALDRLNEGQRKVFKEEQLYRVIKTESPEGIGLQENGRISAFYRRKHGYLRVILERNSFLTIRSFTNPATMPNLDRL